MAQDVWAAPQATLAELLTTMTGDEYVVLGEPAPPAGEPQGLLRRRAAPPPHRFVQFLRDDEELYGECVGATLFGGEWELGEADHQRVRALGWLAPGDPDPSGTQPAVAHYWCTVPRGDAAELAARGIGALQVMGVDPAALDWEHQRR
ncbi:hypothetical protein LRP67_08290 [Nocardioides sp. cx-169]|uniref:TY-Chap domain-containing protein n=1 Tax=Nocardioides sp. cx-169 TaxID=2899080 RepID=UPI001E5869B7|nr:hypothetical protein [Nocardioides sp. cx-169]MCD4534075.1 hypothetical protein [Nocardioides sp. cx-169]